MRSPFTRVPRRLPRSSTNALPFWTTKRACRRETVRSVSRKVTPSGARPTTIGSPANGTIDRVPASSSMTSFIGPFLRRARPLSLPVASRQAPHEPLPVLLGQHDELVDLVAGEDEIDPVALVEAQLADGERGRPRGAVVDDDARAGGLAVDRDRPDRRVDPRVDAGDELARLDRHRDRLLLHALAGERHLVGLGEEHVLDDGRRREGGLGAVEG